MENAAVVKLVQRCLADVTRKPAAGPPMAGTSSAEIVENVEIYLDDEDSHLHFSQPIFRLLGQSLVQQGNAAAMGNTACCSNGKETMQLLANSAKVTGAKKACLVGINYRDTSAELRGCINDVYNMQKVLVEQYGFKIEDILMINEDQEESKWPYKKVILEGMDWLYKGAKPGDLLFFHYSGHGSQYQADKKTMPADVICPLDCVGDEPWPDAVILDTEIHQKLYDPLPLGCKSICLFDCCHSATVANLSETMVVEQGPVTADMKEALVQQLQKRKDAVQARLRFYQEVNQGKLDLKKKSREELLQLFEKHQFPKGHGDTGYAYLLNQKIIAFSTESVKHMEHKLARKEAALKHAQSLKVGDPAKIYIGNLEQDLEDDYEKQQTRRVTQSGEVRLRYLPQPWVNPPKEEELRQVKALGAGLRGVLKTEKYKDHQLWVFSGCQDDETSADAHVEGIYQGAFTWALIKALKEDRFKESYRKLLIQLKSNLELGQYKQVPALSTTHDLYLDYGFCGKLQADGCVIEG
ncbi:unnamed protein product [Durusdinium trenchii]|uniref:Peptidase C14 caspase domain-containing protein n=1 Tax=Durusdinium trenchii TaxID=1381693 RepID=A0ABP0SFR7_9DINO